MIKTKERKVKRALSSVRVMFYMNQLRDCSEGETPATFHDKYETLEQPWGLGAEAEF